MSHPALSLRPTALNISDVGRIWLGVSLRPIFTLIIAVAMLFAPLAMQSGSAMAAMPDHHGQMTEKGHCGEQPAKSTDSKSEGKSCCVATCTAIAIAPIAPVEPLAFLRSVDRPSLEQFGPSFLAKLPTPPPRFA